MKKIFCLLFLFIFSFVFISCDENNPVIDDPVIDDIYYEVKFVIDTKEEVVKVKENTKVIKPDDPEKVGFEFIGWFNDDTLYDFNTLVTKDITIIAKFNELDPILEISVLDNKLNMGYSTQINAKFYNTEEVSLKYKVDKEDIVYINYKGVVTALRPGVVKITAYTESLVSNEIEIEVLDEIINEEDKIDLKGYAIKTSSYGLSRENLKGSLLHFIENLEKKYNFKLEYVPESSQLDDIDFAFSQSRYNDYDEIKYYTDNNMFFDITDLFNKYKEKYPLIINDYTEFNKYKYHGKLYKLYIPSFAQSQTLYYDLDLLNALGVTDPIDLYLEGKWTYSNFIAWCEEAKAILDKTNKEEEKGIYSSYRYVLSGEEFLWYQGLMSTVNKTVFDPITKEIQFESTESKNIKQLFNYLLDKEMYSKYDFHFECLLHAMDDFYANNYRYVASNISIIPFPYPDDYNPKDVKFTCDYSYYDEYVFPNLKISQYPEGVEFEDIFSVVCEILNYRYLLCFSDEDYKLSNLKHDSWSNNEKNLEIYTHLSSEDYVYDPFYFFDEIYKGKLISTLFLIKDYLYYDNYQELDRYKDFMDYYNFVSNELNAD